MKNSNLIFLHRLIYAFGNAMIKVYIPIIILKQTNNVLLSFLYLAIFSLMSGLLTNILRFSIQKNNIFYIIIQIIPMVAIPIIIAFAPMNILCVLLIAILSGIANGLYFPSLNYLFAKLDKNNNAGKYEIGKDLGEVAFLLVSGFILGSSLSNSILIVCGMAVIFYLCSIIPLFFCYKSLKEFINENTTHIPLIETHKKLKPYDIMFATMGYMQMIIQCVIPIYLYKINVNIESIAIVLATIGLGKVFINYLAQKLTDKKKILLCCTIASIMFVSSCVAIILIQVGVAIYILSVILGLTFPFMHVSTFSLYCKDLEFNGKVADGIVLREMYIFYPRAILFTVFIFVPSFLLMFNIGIISGIIFPFAVKTRLKKNEQFINQIKIK
ncbi:MAG: MFS transporter [Clostridia bacterium]|nr:hypothetical protein [Clostridia bacterium]